MPAKSVKQRRAMAIAEHTPSKLHPSNKAMLRMDKADMHDFASTPEKGLPSKVGKSSKFMKRKSSGGTLLRSF